jgi:hypothetical protein
VILRSPPQNTVIVNDHVFFEVENRDFEQHILTTEIVDYGIANDRKRLIEFPNASKWQYEHYGGIPAPRSPTNIIHFQYKPVGKRLADGKDYDEGFYSYDVISGNIQGPVKLMEGEYDKSFTYKDQDGRYVYFEGRDAPIHGLKLVSSPWSDLETKDQDPKGEKVKVLQTFSRLPTLTGGMYWLDQMSPDGRYALIRLQEPASRKSGIIPGFMNTYYLVDASNGKTRVLIKDEVERRTVGSIPKVRWVGGAPEPPN